METAPSTDIVAFMGNRAVEELLGLFADSDVQVVRQPRTGLVMMTMTDSFLTDFHLGEVLVTEAAVTVEGVEGVGMVPGEEPRRALARAVTEACLANPDFPLREGVSALLKREEFLLHSARERDWKVTASSRVNFDLMAGA